MAQNFGVDVMVRKHPNINAAILFAKICGLKIILTKQIVLLHPILKVFRNDKIALISPHGKTLLFIVYSNCAFDYHSFLQQQQDYMSNL
jgi:hypothetical protein